MASVHSPAVEVRPLSRHVEAVKLVQSNVQAVAPKVEHAVLTAFAEQCGDRYKPTRNPTAEEIVSRGRQAQPGPWVKKVPSARNLEILTKLVQGVSHRKVSIELDAHPLDVNRIIGKFGKDTGWRLSDIRSVAQQLPVRGDDEILELLIACHLPINGPRYRARRRAYPGQYIPQQDLLM